MSCNNPTKNGDSHIEETNFWKLFNILTPQGNRFFLKLIILTNLFTCLK